MVSNNPPAFADIRLFVGEQRSGKSTTMVGFSIEDYFKHMTALSKIKLDDKGQPIKDASGEIIILSQVKARCLNKDDMATLFSAGLQFNPYINYSLIYCRIFDKYGNSAIVKIPDDCIAESPVHIFANFHLFGVRYAFISIVDIITYINTDMFDNAWILSDESVMNDPRNSMEATGKLMATFGATIGKRNAKLCLATQLTEMMERRFRAFANTTITCAYDESTKLITLGIKRRDEDESEIDLYEPQYRRFFKSEEKILVPQNKINNALARVYKATNSI